MASDHPDDLPPDQPRPPSGSHAHPESLPVGDWLTPDDADRADQPTGAEEMIDFSTLPEPSDPGAASLSEFVALDDAGPDDGDPSSVIGLLPADPEPQPGGLPVAELPMDSVDVLADLPPAAPAQPASGWLESGVNLGRTPAASPANASPPAEEASDIFTGTAPGESDVIRSLAEPPVDDSSVFPPNAGSSRFDDPRDATDHGAGPPSGVLRRPDAYTDTDAAEEAAWAALADDEPPAAGPGDSSVPLPADAPGDGGSAGLDFNQLDPSASGSAVFADAHETFGGSGVNLLNPEADPADRAFTGAESSIFDAPPAAHAEPPPARPPVDDTTDDVEIELFDDGETGAGHSAIFTHPAGSESTIPDADLLEPDVDDFTLGDGQEGESLTRPDAPTQSFSPDAADDEATEIDMGAGGPEALDLGAEGEAESPWGEQPATDDALGLVGGTANLHGLTNAAHTPPAAPKPARRPAAPLPLDGAREEDEPPARTARPAAAKRGVGGWIGGGLAGLAAGVGACAAAYFAGLIPTEPGPQTQMTASAPSAGSPHTIAQHPPVPVKSTVEDAQALLAAGDPARALEAFEAAGEVDAPVLRAARGQARWQARVRELAAANTPVRADDPQLRQAVADLQAVVDAAADLTTAEERQAAVQAALHLGLLKELSGDAAEAARIYSTAAAKFPASRQVFTTALHRLRVMNPAGKAARLTPRQAVELSHASVIALTLLQAGGAPAAAAADEPAYLFWEAVNHAVGGDYARARAAITRAGQLHDRRRLALVGRGLNPQSDPLEQVFLRTCAELADYWKLRGEVYGHPTFGPLARKDGVSKSLTGLVAVQNTAAELSARVAAVSKEAADAKAAVARLEKENKAAVDDLAAAGEKLTETAKARDMAQKAADDRAKEVAAARARAADADKRLKAAEGALAAVVKELKAAKLVPDADDAAAVLAKLPAVMKQAASAAASADAKKAAEALAAARKDLDAARAEAAKAKADLIVATAAAHRDRADAEKAAAAAKAEADKLLTATKTVADMAVSAARAEAKGALARLDAEVKKAAAAAQAAAQKKLDELAAAAKAAQAEVVAQREAADAKLAQAQAAYAAKLAAKDEQHRRELAAARAGVEVPLTTTEQVAEEQAVRDFTTGVDLYFRGRYAEAEARLAAATKADEADARYWYFLGLARRKLGRDDPEAFQTGAKWEGQNQPPFRVVNASLERIQGADRRELQKYRP